MLLSDLLILSGPITYVSCWLAVILIIIFIDITNVAKAALLAYAIAPVGAISQTFSGYALACLGY